MITSSQKLQLLTQQHKGLYCKLTYLITQQFRDRNRSGFSRSMVQMWAAEWDHRKHINQQLTKEVGEAIQDEELAEDFIYDAMEQASDELLGQCCPECLMSVCECSESCECCDDEEEEEEYCDSCEEPLNYCVC